MELHQFEPSDLVCLSIKLEDDIGFICTADMIEIPKWAIDEKAHLKTVTSLLNRHGEGVDIYKLLSYSEDCKEAKFVCTHCGNIIKASITYMTLEEFAVYRINKLKKMTFSRNKFRVIEEPKESLEDILKERGINLN